MRILKISFRDKIILVIAVFTFICYGGYHLLWIPADAKIAELKERENELKGLALDVTPLIKQADTLEAEQANLLQKINEVKSNGNNKTLSKVDFLVFLGQSSEKNNVKVTRFNDLGLLHEQNNVWKEQFDFEIKGTAESINNLCLDIDNIGIKYSVGSMSFRQTSDYPYLKRFFDNNSNLKWYKEPTPTEQPILEDALPDSEGSSLKDSYNALDSEWGTKPQLETTPEPKITPEPTPTPQPNDDTIMDRLDRLLEQTSFNKNYKVMLLTNTDEAGNEMKLAITVQFIIFDEPSLANSFHKEGS